MATKTADPGGNRGGRIVGGESPSQQPSWSATCVVRLARLEFQNLRVLRDGVLIPASSLNLLIGPNGSGKSTVLEGISFLGLGRSFRTRRSREAISWGADQLGVFGVVERDEGGAVALGIERREKGGRIRINGKDVGAASELARVLPLLVITQDSESILSGGSEQRRRLMDWTLFHVEQRYLAVYQAYQRVLRHRNALLKGVHDAASRESWDRQLGELGEALHGWRGNYAKEMMPLISEVAGELGAPVVNAAYWPGWDLEYGLTEQLAAVAERDLRQGWTGVGPHRADLAFEVNGFPARKILSRGEGRLWVGSVVLAHLRYVAMETGMVPVVLVDDYGGELDAPSRERFLEALGKLGGQMFVTAVSEEGFRHASWEEKKVFHVKQARITEMV